MSNNNEPPKKHSKNEGIKVESNFLRGTIAEGLADDSTGSISAIDAQLTKFHGTYLQDDRDKRRELLKERRGWDVNDFKDNLQALIVTQGGEGSTIYTPENDYQIPIVIPSAVCDPTGCGDAYRAGLLYGLLHGYDWMTTGCIASLMGAIKIESHGTQNHHFELEEFEQRFEASFGHALKGVEK